MKAGSCAIHFKKYSQNFSNSVILKHQLIYWKFSDAEPGFTSQYLVFLQLSVLKIKC